MLLPSGIGETWWVYAEGYRLSGVGEIELLQARILDSS